MKMGVVELDIYLPWALSLKDKRNVARSIIKKLQNKYNIAVSQIHDLDNIKKLNLGLVLISNNENHLNEMLDKVLDFIEDEVDGDWLLVNREIMNFTSNYK